MEGRELYNDFNDIATSWTMEGRYNDFNYIDTSWTMDIVVKGAYCPGDNVLGGYCPEGYWRGILSEGILTGGYCPRGY